MGEIITLSASSAAMLRFFGVTHLYHSVADITKRAFQAFGLEVSRLPSRYNSLPPQPALVPPLPPSSTNDLLQRVNDPFRSALDSLIKGSQQVGIDGELHIIDLNVQTSPPQGTYIYELCLALKPKYTLEIGMAYGFSTLYILAAVAKNHYGHHTAIDPFQRTYWHGIGLVHATKYAPSHERDSSFRLIEERSDRAATDLARANEKFDLIYIDGNHRFDDVLVDFYLYSQLCNIGGIILFDDIWMNSIRSVVEYVRTNRRDFRICSSPVPNLAIFQKIDEDSRDWKEFVKFRVSSSSA